LNKPRNYTNDCTEKQEAKLSLGHYLSIVGDKQRSAVGHVIGLHVVLRLCAVRSFIRPTLEINKPVGLKIEIHEIHEIHQNLRNPVSLIGL